MLSPETTPGGAETLDPTRGPTAASGGLSQIPDPLQRFRNREPKALGVALVLLGVILFLIGIPIVTTIPSWVIQIGTPCYTAVLLVISGSLAIVSEKSPRKELLTACFTTAVVSAAVGGVTLVMYLVDLNNSKKVRILCSIPEWCFHTKRQQRHMFAFVPVLYLLTLCGMMLSIILSINLCDVLRNWDPDLNRLERPVMSAPGDAEGSVEQGNIRMGELEQVPASGDQDQRRSRPAGTGQRSLLVQKFLEGEPKMLGVLHIVLGLSLLIITVPYLILRTNEEIVIGLIWWLVVQCIVSGVLSIAAEDRPTINMDLLELMSELFPLLFLLLALTISVVLASYARKSLWSVGPSKMTVIMNPSQAQDPLGDGRTVQ